MSSFTPSWNTVVTQTGSNVNTAIGVVGVPVGHLYLYNSGANKAFVKWGAGTQTAASDGTCFAIAPGAYFLVSKGLADNVAVIGTAADVVYISAGEGQ